MVNELKSKYAKYFSGKRVLITGASGFLASNLLDTLKHLSCTVVCLSRRGGLIKIASTALIQEVIDNISNPKIWEEILPGVDIVYHFAAQTSIYVAENDPYLDLKSNVLPMLYMLETCRRKNLDCTILFAGTATEVGMTSYLPVSEAHTDAPITLYDHHKLLAETYLINYSRRFLTKGTSLRLPNIYGPGPKSSNRDRGVVNAMIRKAISGETISIYNKGTYLRDYIYVKDVITAFLEATTKIDRVTGKFFYIGSGRGYTINEIAQLIVERVALRTGKRSPVQYVDPPSDSHQIEFRNFIADFSAFKEATNWEPSYSLIEGIDKTINSIIN